MEEPTVTAAPPPPRVRIVPGPAPLPGSGPDHAGAARLNLDALAVRWQLALAAAERAVAAADGAFPPSETRERSRALAGERHRTAELLVHVARVAGAEQLPWLAPVPPTPLMLGLPRSVKGCLFDLEGVLTDGARLQSWAWATVFDDFLERLGARAGWRLEPFGNADYRTYVDGRPRLEGVHAFLASRGIVVPEGDPLDAADAETAHGLARRKGQVLARGLQPLGVTALAGARRYLEAAGQAGLARAAVSASSSTRPMLELAGLATLVDAQIDADVMAAGHLRARPAPDLLLAACRLLELAPEETATFTHTPAGVAAGRAAGLVVVGVAEGLERDLLGGEKTRTVPSLAMLLDTRLTSDRELPRRLGAT